VGGGSEQYLVPGSEEEIGEVMADTEGAWRGEWECGRNGRGYRSVIDEPGRFGV
jgi:hypothetical protein